MNIDPTDVDRLLPRCWGWPRLLLAITLWALMMGMILGVLMALGASASAVPPTISPLVFQPDGANSGRALVAGALLYGLTARSAPPVVDDLDAVTRAEVTGSALESAPGASAAHRSAAEPSPTGWPVLAEPTREERRLINVARHHCPLAGPRHLDVFQALQLLRLEQDVGVPSYMRGISLAAWCREAAYQTKDVVGDGGRAEGPMQLHGLLASHCGPEYARHSLPWSARCYLHHVARVAAKVERRCGRRARPSVWVVAEAWTAGGSRYSSSCRAVSSHGVLLNDWHRRLARAVLHERAHAAACEEVGL